MERFVIRCVSSVLSRETSFGAVCDQVHILGLSRETSFGAVCDPVHILGLSRETSFGVVCDQVASFSVLEGRWGFVRFPLGFLLILRYRFKGMRNVLCTLSDWVSGGP